MLTVKKLADLLGLSPEVIRHYTHMGILKPVVNSGNNYKYYDEQDLLYLANIRVNRSLGLSLPQAQVPSRIKETCWLSAVSSFLPKSKNSKNFKKDSPK